LRIVVPTIGSRGDVQPFVGLGMGLQAAGHDVCLATHADFEPLVRSHDVDFFSVEVSGQALQRGAMGTRMLGAGGNPFAFMSAYVRLRLPIFSTLLERTLEACRGADLVLLSPTAFLVGYSVAEKLGLPMMTAHLQPMTMSRHAPSCLFPEAPRWMPLRGLYNLVTHVAAGEYMWQISRSTVNQARADVLALPPLPLLGPPPDFFRRTPALHGYSEHVVPRPPDLPACHHTTGYWFLDPTAPPKPREDLAAFVENGPPPVYVGFGSVHNVDVEGMTDLVVQALERCGQRGVLLTGWGGLSDTARSERVFVVDSVSHTWLFPRSAAVVHHGGAGTTAATFRSGVPGVIVPYNSDQPFWARRAYALGVSPPPLPRQQLSVERLAQAIDQAVHDPAIRSNAALLGECIRAEDGVANAVTLIDQFGTSAARQLCPAS
jgi:UDP:flavonoid glycosyltransferase YjiC (YdhE family)